MDFHINSLEISNFKSFSEKQTINISDLSVLLGANSSGKSTALQALLLIKQTMECNSPDIDLLLSGKYVVLGDYNDVISDNSRDCFSIGLNFYNTGKNEYSEKTTNYCIKWTFCKADATSQAVLDRINVEYDGYSVQFIRCSQHRFKLIVDNEETQVAFEIKNLCFPQGCIIYYDKVLNKQFADFLNALIRITEGNKTPALNTKDLVSEQVDRAILKFISNYEDVEVLSEDSLLAKKICKLIDDYNMELNPLGNNAFAILQSNIIEIGIANAIAISKRYGVFEKVYEEYSEKLESYIKEKQSHIFEGEARIPWILDRSFDNQRGNSIREAYLGINSFYTNIESFFHSIFFLGPIRELPRGLYSIGFENIPKYVGPTGSNFASVLLHENKNKDYILPNNEIENMTLMDAVAEWAVHLNIANAVHVEQSNSFGINVSVSNTQNVDADIMNVGIGTSQVLPVLIMGLLSERNEVLVFEQPELHLHPFSQSRLADFFVELIRHGRIVIVETHSDTFLLRLRYNLLTNQCPIESVSVNFFVNDNGTKVQQCDITGYGTIEYPADFRDETQRLLNELAYASLEGRKTNERSD